MRKDEPGDLRTSFGEVVRRVDLVRAAGGEARLAGYEGVLLARAALSGDQSAVDRFHDLVGLVLPGVVEYGEKDVVRLVMTDACDDLDPGEVGRAAFRATNEEGYNCTDVDAAGLVRWILSPEGKEALARRGVLLPVDSAEGMGSADLRTKGEPVTLTEHTALVQEIRRWVQESPRHATVTLTRDQLQGLMSVFDYLTTE